VSRTGIVVAMAAEGRCLGRARARADGLDELDSGTLVALTGPGAAAAAAGAQRLREAGAAALVSFGLAGGLDPALPAGALVLPEETSDGCGCLATDAAWRGRIRNRLQWAAPDGRPPPAHGGRLLSATRALTSVCEKAAAFAAGARAVDLESHAVAAAAGVPFVAVRVIVDTAADELPAPLATVVSAGGRVRPGEVAEALLRRPALLGALLHLAGRYRIALGTLRAVARAGVDYAPRQGP